MIVCSTGELLVFTVPRFLGFVPVLPAGALTDPFPQMKLQGSVTAAAASNGRVVLGTDVGEMLCIDIVEDLNKELESIRRTRPKTRQ